MDIINLISEFSKLRANVNTHISSLKSSFNDENEFWLKVEAMDKAVLLDNKAINIIADAMQMVNNKERLKSFDLSDIKRYTSY
ncbi:hypothetical protein ACFQ3S_02500 [Mucilaginibacter terrae]|uniref:hypothetical protein n=1 Tax=Mucilaginibacter terrae TaxID=1955052 RepID=UPI003640C6FA